MALQTKSFSYGDYSYQSYSNAYVLELVLAEESTNVERNVSLVSYTLRLKSGAQNRFSQYYVGATITLDGTVVASRDRYSTAQVSLDYNSSVDLISGSTTIAHDADGSKSISVAFAIDMATGNYVPGPLTASGYSMALTSIPRKSTISIGSGTLGDELSFSVVSNSSSFSHTVTCTASSGSGGRSATPLSGVSGLSGTSHHSWTPPLEWASLNSAGTTISVTVKLETFSGGVSIGADVQNIVCTIPASVVPSCEISVNDAAGYASTYGYIKNKSMLSVTVTPSLAYGSEIVSYSVNANGATYSTNSFKTGVLKTAGTMTVTATVTDRRGRKGSASVSVTVQDYANPVVSKLTVKRCNSDGSANAKGAYVQAIFSAAVTSLNSKNAAEYTLQYKKTSASSYASVSLSALKGSYAVSNSAYIFSADPSSSYDVVLTVKDAFGASSRSAVASTGFILVHYSAEGTSMGIGKRSERSNALDLGVDFYLNNNRITGVPSPTGDSDAVPLGRLKSALKVTDDGAGNVVITFE